jgi:hypothetical protein
MDPDLEALLAADEDACARVEAARASAAARIAAARADERQRREQQAAAAREALARELERIESETGAAIEGRRRARRAYSDTRRAAASLALVEAADVFAAAIRGDG